MLVPGKSVGRHRRRCRPSEVRRSSRSSRPATSPKARAVADQHPLHADDGQGDHAVHHRAEDVLAPDHAAVEQGQPGHHEHAPGRWRPASRRCRLAWAGLVGALERVHGQGRGRPGRAAGQQHHRAGDAGETNASWAGPSWGEDVKRLSIVHRAANQDARVDRRVVQCCESGGAGGRFRILRCVLQGWVGASRSATALATQRNECRKTTVPANAAPRTPIEPTKGPGSITIERPGRSPA